jgi:hypothetical protein
MERKDSSETPLDKCKKVLEDFLLNTEWLPICSKNVVDYLDSDIAHYLVKNGYREFLVEDVSFGPQVGGVSERVLIDFARSGRVFEGRAGRFRVEEDYGPHSVRCFQALPA